MVGFSVGTLARASAVALVAATAASSATALLEPVEALLSRFVFLGVGQGFSSAVRSLDDTLYFWGDQVPTNSLDVASSATWLTVEGGTNVECGIVRTTLKVRCWGASNPIVSEAPGPDDPDSVGLQLAIGQGHVCMITFDESLVEPRTLTLVEDTPESNLAFLRSVRPVCWGAPGQNSDQNLSPPQIGNAEDGDPVVSIHTGNGFTCVHTFKGRVACSGTYGNGDASTNRPVPQNVLFKTVAAGELHACGVPEDSTSLVCWGECSALGECNSPDGVQFSGATGALSAGRTFTCGLTLDDEPVCTGSARFWPLSRSAPTDVPMLEINSGLTHTCGIRRNDTDLQCWGECSFRECDPPASFNTVPCQRQPPSGTCYRGVSPGLCEIRECTSGFQWRLGGVCNCFFVLGDMPVYLGEATNGQVRCGVRRDVPRFQLVRGDADNVANNCV
eukprot:contig_29587_g7264